MTALDDLPARGLADSRAWFPGLHGNTHDLLIHYTLGIAGEVGELVNLIKKWSRGAPLDVDAVSDECADVLIYLMDIMGVLGIVPSEAIEHKRAVLVERWGVPG